MPIRDQALIYSPNVNSVERGVAYTQAATQRVRTARFYANTLPVTPQTSQCGLVNIYPYGLEDQTGPIRQVIIPVNSATTTGANISILGGGTAAEAVFQPAGTQIQFDYNAGTPQRASFFFDIDAYPVLANKRILNVSVLYSGWVYDQDPATGNLINFVNPTPSTSMTLIRQRTDANAGQLFTAPQGGQLQNTGTLVALSTSIANAAANPGGNVDVGVLDIGDINNYWDPATSPTATTERQPWRYVDLQRLQVGATNRQMIWLQVQMPSTAATVAGFPTPSLFLDYLALRVIYCEEKRVAYGARLFGYAYGMNAVTMRDPSFNADPALAAGQYLPTLSWVSPGLVDFGLSLNGEFPDLNALTELYQIPTHPAVEVAVPFPLAERLGETFTSQASHILPQLSLHASGGTLTEPHVYGRQAAAQVYGVNTATQDIYDDITGVANTYPQVRYYARRFGDTVAPLTLTGVGTLSGSTASITVADFDDLVEILDGWKEVTLRFATPPSMGTVAGNPAWTWSAVGETSGNRWEILSASAPAVSGIPGRFLNYVPAPDTLGPATYQPPAGSTVELTWMPHGIASAWVTGSTIDANTDAVLIFSTDPATVTGVSLSQLTQSVSGIGGLCGGVPCCIPTGIGYQQINWGLPVGTGVGSDGFRRVVAAGSWDPADVGGNYNLNGTAADFSVNNAGLITFSAVNSSRFATLGFTGASDFDVTVSVTFRNSVLTGELRAGAAARYTDGSNNYYAVIEADSAGALTLQMEKRVAGVVTVLGSVALPGMSGGPGATNNVRLMVVGTLLKAKAWRADGPEPAGWNLETTDSSLTTGTRAGVFARDESAVTGHTVAFGSLIIGPPAYWFGAYELQRWDAVTGGDFATIMLATDVAQTSFNDFEARVGVTAVYRIRSLNALNFAGSWSTYVSGAPPAPGVTGGCGSQDGTLIFTSNADQTGADNAAYVMQWDNTPVEAFDLPEADMVSFQPMYGRDGSIAFHGTERGLEEFSRNVLLQAGAIALPSLADAADIRDLAWVQLPYVCVRDDRGNRWFSNVRVNGVNARNNAQNYMAGIAVTETTRTPYPVDP